MSKKLIGTLLALIVVIGGVIIFFTDGDDKDNKKEKSELVTRDYKEDKDKRIKRMSTPLHIEVKADVKDEKEVQEVLNKVAQDFGKDNRDSLEVTVISLEKEKKERSKLLLTKRGRVQLR